MREACQGRRCSEELKADPCSDPETPALSPDHNDDDNDDNDDDGDDDDDDLVSAEGGEETRGGTAIAFQPAALKDCHHDHDYHYNDDFEDFKCDDYER